MYECKLSITREFLDLHLQNGSPPLRNCLDHMVGRLNCCGFKWSCPGAENVVPFGPNNCWLDSKAAITCYSIYHFLANCYAVPIALKNVDNI